MSTRAQQAVALEARRAKVSDLLVQRLTYREIGALLGISAGAVFKDVAVLRKQWAKNRGAYEDQLADQAMALDAWQRQVMDDMPSLTPEKRLSAIDTLLRISDQRNRLFGLYPRPGQTDEQDMPTGPIELRIEVVPSGNRQLIDAEYTEPDYAELDTGDQPWN